MSTQQVTEYYLRIPEILISIFEHLPAKDIYNCSKVCKEWDHLAFSTLGRIHAVRFDNLIAILGLAPFSYARLDDRKLKLGLLGDNILNHVTEFRWDRFLRLCAPVRELCAGRDWEHQLIMDAILNLLAKFQGQMLPKLETVKMTSISFKGNNQLPEGFFTSRVKRVLLQHPQHVSTRGSHCDRLVQVLQRKSPHLEELEFPCVTPGDVISFSAFQSFKSLQRLKMNGYISLQAIISLTRCTSLRSLSLTDFRLWNSEDVDLSYGEITKHDISEWLESRSKSIMPIIEELEVERVSCDHNDRDDMELNELLWKKLSFPSLKHIMVGTPDSRPSPWLESRVSRWLVKNMKGSPYITQVTVLVRPYLTRDFLDRLPGHPNIKRIRIIEDDHPYIQRFHPHDLCRWLAALPWLDAFEWILPHHPCSPEFGELPKLETLLQLIVGLPGLPELALPLDGSNMLSQLKTWHNLTETEKDRTIGSSASLVSLELYVMDIEPSDVEPTVRVLMEILPHELALRVFIRPITYREEGDGAKEDEIEGKQEGAGLDRNVAMEAQFKMLIESYRAEREGGGKM